MKYILRKGFQCQLPDICIRNTQKTHSKVKYIYDIKEKITVVIKGLSYLEPNCVGGNSKHVFYVRYYFLGAFLKKNLTSHRSNMMHQCKIMKSFLIVKKDCENLLCIHIQFCTHARTQSLNPTIDFCLTHTSVFQCSIQQSSTRPYIKTEKL